MNNQWKIDGKVSTSKQAFSEIKKMPQTVGIVLYGANCNLKDEVINELLSNLPGLATSTNAAPTPVLVKYIQEHSIVAVLLSPEESASRKLRHELVKVMRNAGAKSMVGIYVKCNKPAPLPGRGFLKPKVANSAKQIAAIERSNPDKDNLDCFIVVEEEK